MKHIWISASRFALLGIILLCAGAQAVSAAEFSAEQKAEIEKIIGDYLKGNPEFIRDYLLEHPDVLLEVSAKLRAQQAEQERVAAEAAMTAHKDQLTNHPMTPVSGNPEGDVTLIEFFDYNCSFCKRAFSYMRSLEKDDPNLRIVWKEYPVLTGRTPASLTAAKVAMAADRQGKYVETHRALMGAGGALRSDRQVLQIAEDVGLDMDRLRKDMESPEIRDYLTETLQMGEALQIQGTPTFIVNDSVIGGAVPKNVLLAVIAAARADGLKPGVLSEVDLGQILRKYGS